ncbi:3-hydroxyacyl-[acyl-carrier-protein] dehydratase FERN, mitochondrial-like [Nicotiana tabacum]|uniref:(R)-specific enoyl-CoA hydratase-like n=2 Tax=Nicotiana TaxID=4085 RepID=A0A1S3XUU0_TOBAC|nr:PREDICTED: (R)-specific enoyl-CoA hydratase-like [Nicotiana tabacum]XP_019224937.1 PREDICTED: uncharacterized protein LOC109206557 [Nicotiana attenuata]OIT33013.1 hypothetical protein A4A49_25611 [Nicotiana attenuata]
MLIKRILSSSISSSYGFSSLSTSSNLLKSGSILKQARTFSDADIIEYSKLTHDANPLHFDAECAKNAGFSDRLVPGMLVASLFPRIIAAHFPGAVYVSQTLHFKLPVYIGDEIIAEVQASSIRQMKNKHIAKLSTKCFKCDGPLVIDGEATAILPSLVMEPTHLASTSS